MRDNQRRIDRALRALGSYLVAPISLHNAGVTDRAVLEEAVIDILSDLRHLCDAAGADFERYVRISGMHHEEER